MLIKELLLEYKLDTDEYGYWIDDDRKAHAVEHQGHTQFLQKIWPGAPDSNSLYKQAYANNWVRVVTNDYDISIKGYMDDIKKNWSRLARNIFTKDNSLNQVVFDIIKSGGTGISDTDYQFFRLTDPAEKNRLMKFMS